MISHQLLIVLALISSVNCDINKILRICEEKDCNLVDPVELNRTKTVSYHRKLLKLISGGVPQLIVENLDQLTENRHISNKCRRRLQMYKDGLDSGREWAFRVLDSSAKVPQAFLDGTVTGFGDFDECLAIESPDNAFAPKYCMVDVFPRVDLAPEKGKISFGQSIMFKGESSEKMTCCNCDHIGSSYFFGLCVPDKCSTQDVRKIVRQGNVGR